MKKVPIDQKVAYSNNQLLLEDDFIQEQQFLLHSRYRENLGLHGWGVARGLEVEHTGELTLRIAPGFALDERGHGIALAEAQTLTLHPHERGTVLEVTLGYRCEGRTVNDRPANRIECSALLQAVRAREGADVTLATVHFHEQGCTVSPQGRRALHVHPGSVSAESLAPPLRRGWMTTAFRPLPVPLDEPDNVGHRPPFLMGATQATAGTKDDPEHKGATSTMGIVLPFGVTGIHACRIAGANNLGEIEALFFKGSVRHVVDAHGHAVVEHQRELLCEIRIAPAHHGYDHRQAVAGGVARFNHPEPDDTLSVLVRATKYCRVSLIGIEVSYA